MTSSLYPKVLFVTPCAFNHVTGGGVTFSNLFRGWPQDRLATVHNDSNPVSTDVCSRYYRLGADDLRPVWPFSYLKKSGSAAPETLPESGDRSDFQTSWIKTLKSWAGPIIGPVGIPDHGILSPRLEEWIRNFSPDLIYTILGTIGYAELVESMRRRFQLPVVIHFMDEGVTDPKGGGLFAPWIRRRYGRLLRDLVPQASARIGICHQMSVVYGKRFGVPFETFMNAVDLALYPPREAVSRGEILRLVYTGAVLPYAQERSLRDCARAVVDLHRQGMKVRFDIYTGLKIYKRHIEGIAHPECVFLQESIEDDAAYFQTLRQADVLISPINFDAQSVHFLKYSMPTKVPSYLSSGTPILVYGPREVAQVEYSEREQWGYVVSQRNPALLKKAILLLAEEATLRETLSRAAVSTARRNHDSALVREQFRSVLERASHG